MQFHKKLTPSQLPLKCNQFSWFGIDINALFTVSTGSMAITKTDGCSGYCQHLKVQLCSTSSPKKADLPLLALWLCHMLPSKSSMQVLFHAHCKSPCLLCSLFALLFPLSCTLLLPDPSRSFLRSQSSLLMLWLCTTYPLSPTLSSHSAVTTPLSLSPTPHPHPIDKDALFMLQQLLPWIPSPTPGIGMLAFHPPCVSLELGWEGIVTGISVFFHKAGKECRSSIKQVTS